jgi:hypothetical protein
MRIHFERAGGFAAPAQRLSASVDTDQLPADKAQEVDQLLQSADIPQLVGVRPSAQRQTRPDMFHYRLTVEAGSQKHTVTVSDADMPEALRPLVHWLTSWATGRPS